MEHKSDHYTGAAAPLLVDQTAGFGLAGLLISGLPFLAPFSPQAWAPAAKQRERAKTKAILRIMVVSPLFMLSLHHGNPRPVWQGVPTKMCAPFDTVLWLWRYKARENRAAWA